MEETRWFRVACRQPLQHLVRIARGHYPGRSPDIVAVPRRPHMYATFDVTTHAGPWEYLQRVPLVFYGPGFVRPVGNVTIGREVTVADLAPTVAELLDFEMPPGTRGEPLEGLLEPHRRERPRLVLVVVWDGGGRNVLNQWPDEWPHLAQLMQEGATITNAVVGSSPSVTPAVHATIGTGTFPAEHGIVDIFVRRGDDVTDAFEGQGPDKLIAPTLADLFDVSEQNEPKIAMVAERSWHLGMIGHGAGFEGGDKDVAVMDSIDGEGLMTTPAFYSLPSYLKNPPRLDDDVLAVDASDGEVDGEWLDHAVLGDIEEIRNSPAWTLYQGRVLRELIKRESFGTDAVPDLLFTNFKQIDEIGHIWNMFGPEMRDGLRYSDQVLGDLVGLLDREVGRGRYVIALTADHGVGPDPLRVGAWPIGQGELLADIARFAGTDADRLFEVKRPGGYWLHRNELDRVDVTIGEIATFLLDYSIGDNVADGAEVPKQYRDRLDERLFAASFPSNAIPQIHSCALRA